MAEKTVLISQQLLKPIKILKWRVTEGNSMSIGSVILLYDFDGAVKVEQRKLKSTQAGTVHKLIAPEGAIIKPGSPLLWLRACIHPTVMKDMCAECGADLRIDDVSTTASIPMVHSIPDLKVSEELAQKLGKADGERLLRDRKLVLLVDLDQTLIHTTNDNIPPNIKDVYHFQLYGPNSPWYHTRLRPGTHDFLNNISPLFELHICTFGARNYAHTITMFLDADQTFFSNRILSRDECFDPTSKKANLKALFPCGDNMVCIIDDREDVWNHALNLIHVKPYHFFQHTGDINAPPGLDKHEQDDKEGVDLTKLVKKPEKPNGKNVKEQSNGLEDIKTNGEKEPIVDEECTDTIEMKNRDVEMKNDVIDREGSDEGVDKAKKLNSEKCDDRMELNECDESKSEDVLVKSDVDEIDKKEIVQEDTSGKESKDDKKLENKIENIQKDVSGKESKDDNMQIEEENFQEDVSGKESKDDNMQNKEENIQEDVRENESKDDTNMKNKEENILEDVNEKENKDNNLENKQEDIQDDVSGRENKDDNNLKNKEENIQEDISPKEKDDKNLEHSEDGEKNKDEIQQSTNNEDNKKPEENTVDSKPAPSIENKKPDDDLIEIEDPDDYLLHLEDILKRIHETFYQQYDKLESGIVPDLKQVIPNVRNHVLKGIRMAFSGLVPTHIKLQQSRAYQVARSLGATVTQDLDDETTHLVAVRPGTAKVNAGRRRKTLRIVTPDWLWSCAERWEHVEEAIYPLNSKGSKNRHPPPHCSSPEHVPCYPVHETPAIRKRTPSGRFMDTINPLMSFSSDDIADMDKEVEDILDDESDESEEEAPKEQTVSAPPMQVEEEESSSSSDESLTGEYPRGFKRTREKRKLESLNNDEDLVESSLDEFPSTKFRRGEQLDSDLDIGQESNSEGSVEPPDEVDDGEWNMMGAALEREFLSNN